ncbi:MAG: response regulator transcription factor [Planctomycetota bacterium]
MDLKALKDSARPATIYLLAISALDRQAYRMLLEELLGRQVAVESDFTPTAVWAAMRGKPNLALVNADTAHHDALDATQMITRLSPTIRILVVGAAIDPLHIQAWRRCKIHGYVVKDGGIEELQAALTAVLDHRQYFSEGVRECIRGAKEASDGHLHLSRRETELLPLLARGLTLRDAASKMAVSYKTADSYRTSLLRKLGLHDRVELARYAIRERIVEP